MSTTRAKFYCGEKRELPGQTDVKLYPVCPSEPEDENRSWWEATPAGAIDLTITNRPAADLFEVGKEYYVDFTPAAAPAEVGAAEAEPAEGFVSHAPDDR